MTTHQPIRRPLLALALALVGALVLTLAPSVLEGADPLKGKKRFRFCRQNTVPGKFKLRGKFTYKVGFDTFDGWIEPTYFRLR